MSFFRYPGGKHKLRKEICRRIWQLSQEYPDGWEYREPFLGGGAVGISLLDASDGFLTASPIRSAWINDKDSGIACIWLSVARFPEELKKRINAFVPSVQAFDDIVLFLKTQQPDLEDSNSVVKFGFYKIAIHQISYSGLGLKSGGPLGGRDQESAYKIDCRWSPDYICKKIDRLSKMMRSVKLRCTSLDFSALIEETGDSVLYLDPPYYEKGDDLYYEMFTKDDHKRLARLLRDTTHRWILSYDDSPEIKALYEWANIETVSVNYSITSLKQSDIRLSRNKNELLISARR